ncbi:Maf family protein [Moraxella sp. FZLJ2107]|uniref:Maf family protein n=1 Tax=unclassified Moraxella TaxID=2685852 RepID=UPI0020C89CE8|nr:MULTISPECIES: Maf family protein [unclassified Moraxella]UTO04709.1 Maf family protein [Moraxella sp. FZLJ2107]UTO21437.1 Maf family protein [Moraxella sp. FZLJ2109]
MNTAARPVIILASTSPRRRELLSQAGIEFMTVGVEVDESWLAGESADAYIRRMVMTKADAVMADATLPTECIVITADTIGVLDDGEVLTKPVDQADAYRMWDKLSDTTHEIWTAVCLTHLSQGACIDRRYLCERTQVEFVRLSDAQKTSYWQSGEPQDKAGAYAIQGGAAAWVRAIHGSYTNVVGLPLSQVVQALDDMLDRPKADQ